MSIYFNSPQRQYATYGQFVLPRESNCLHSGHRSKLVLAVHSLSELVIADHTTVRNRLCGTKPRILSRLLDRGQQPAQNRYGKSRISSDGKTYFHYLTRRPTKAGYGKKKQVFNVEFSERIRWGKNSPETPLTGVGTL